MPIRTINKSSVHDFSGMAFAMVHDHCRQRYCPLGMSAFGTKRTFHFARHMSALGGIADVAIKGQNAGFLSPIS